MLYHPHLRASTYKGKTIIAGVKSLTLVSDRDREEPEFEALTIPHHGTSLLSQILQQLHVPFGELCIKILHSNFVRKDSFEVF